MNEEKLREELIEQDLRRTFDELTVRLNRFGRADYIEQLNKRVSELSGKWHIPPSKIAARFTKYIEELK